MSDNETPTTEKQPWWNDGDKMGGLIATIAALLILIFIAMLLVKFGMWLF